MKGHALEMNTILNVIRFIESIKIPQINIDHFNSSMPNLFSISSIKTIEEINEKFQYFNFIINYTEFSLSSSLKKKKHLIVFLSV